jgi:hypothetical protein
MILNSLPVFDGVNTLLATLARPRIKVDLKKLPSQGYFYPKDLEIWITIPSEAQIQQYNQTIHANEVGAILQLTLNNVHVNEGHTIQEIRSIDLTPLFLLIVKATTKKEIKGELNYRGETQSIKITPDSLALFDFGPYADNIIDGEIHINGWRFSPPTIGAEHSFAENLEKLGKAEEVDYLPDFLFFLGNKTYLTEQETDNLFDLFEGDLPDSDYAEVCNIVDTFTELITMKYKNKQGKSGIAKIDVYNLFNA